MAWFAKPTEGLTAPGVVYHSGWVVYGSVAEDIPQRPGEMHLQARVGLEYRAAKEAVEQAAAIAFPDLAFAPLFAREGSCMLHLGEYRGVPLPDLCSLWLGNHETAHSDMVLLRASLMHASNQF